MPAVSAKIPQIKGLVPALDRKQVGAPHVVDGQNFLVDAEGPYSAFGAQFITYSLLYDNQFVQTFRLSRTQSVIFVSNAVLSFDETSQKYHPIFTFDSVAERFPWSHALVGGVHYFARKGQDLLQYFPLLDSWFSLNSSNTLGLAPDIYAVTASFGRLIIAANSLVQWSAIDIGTDLVTSTATGAGAQSLSIVNNGLPVGIFSNPTGFSTYTTEGIMRSEFVDSLNPFRHDSLSDEHVPISAFALTKISKDAVVFLDETGLYRNNGQKIEPWQSLMSEFLHRQVLPNFDQSVENNSKIRLFYNSDRQWFFISIADVGQSNVYDFSYVLYLPRDEWGIFNNRHTGLGEFVLTSGPEVGFNYGYVTPEGHVKKFITLPQKEAVPDFKSNIFFRTEFEMPVHYEDSVIHAHTEIDIQTYDKSNYISTGLHNSSFQIVARDFQSIDSFIDVGVFRFDDQQYADRFSYMTNLMIGMLKSAGVFTTEDWNLTVPDEFEDWNALTGQEDWGEGLVGVVNYTIQVQGTLDGYIQYENQIETPEEVENINTDANLFAKYFTCYNSGIYHIIKLSALLQGESFHAKFAEPTIVPGGRI